MSNRLVVGSVVPQDSVEIQKARSGVKLATRYTIEALIGKGKGTRVYRVVSNDGNDDDDDDDDDDDGSGAGVVAPAASNGARTVNVEAGAQRTRSLFAIKQFDRGLTPSSSAIEGVAEAELLLTLQHENVVRVLGYIVTQRHVYIVMPHYEHGSLFKLMKKHGAFPESVARRLMHMVLGALRCVHASGYLHRDIKSSNVLVDVGGNCVLADFGLACVEQSAAAAAGADVVGTPYWMAPELAQALRASQRSDVWSVGCLLVELLVTVPPLFTLGPMAALYRIGNDSAPLPMPLVASASAVRFLESCFVRDYNRRATVDQLLRHEWIIYSDVSPISIEEMTSLMKAHQLPPDPNYSIASNSSTDATSVEGSPAPIHRLLSISSGSYKNSPTTVRRLSLNVSTTPSSPTRTSSPSSNRIRDQESSSSSSSSASTSTSSSSSSSEEIPALPRSKQSSTSKRRRRRNTMSTMPVTASNRSSPSSQSTRPTTPSSSPSLSRTLTPSQRGRAPPGVQLFGSLRSSPTSSPTPAKRSESLSNETLSSKSVSSPSISAWRSSISNDSTNTIAHNNTTHSASTSISHKKEVADCGDALLDKLAVMFPKLSLDALRKSLAENNGDFDKTQQALLRARKISVLQQIYGEFSVKTLTAALTKHNDDVDQTMAFLRKKQTK